MAEKDLYPLSNPQMSIWYTEKLYTETSISNIAGTLRINGDIDLSILNAAVNLVVKNNEGLRLRITEASGTPMQYVSDFIERQYDVVDFSNAPIEALYKWEEEQSRIPLPMIDHELFYMAIFRVNQNDTGFFLKIHHIISDAWSIVLIGKMILENYVALSQQTEIEEKRFSYTDYIKDEKIYLDSKRFLSDKTYWHQQYDSLPELTMLKTRKSSSIQTKAKRRTFITPAKFNKKLYQYCKDNSISPYPLFLAAFSMYINRVTAKNDITIGTPLLNRTSKEDKNRVGMFINTVPFRIDIDENLDFKTFSCQVLGHCAAMLRHQKYPSDMLLKEIRKKFNSSELLFDIVVSYQNTKFDKYGLDTHSRWHFNGHQTNSLTIHINDRDDEGKIIVDYDFHTDLYHAKEVDYLHTYMISLLWHALDNPEKPIKNLEMLTESEKHRLLYDFNNTEADYPKDKTIHQLFEEQAERTPDSIALVFEDKEMTYRELNEKSNSLARVLRDKGIEPDQIVGLMVHRSFEMIIGILGILKAGGAYLPIDPDYPTDRIQYMLNDSKTNILLTQTSGVVNIDYDGVIIDLSTNSLYNSALKNNLKNVNKPGDLIYVIYTSGSTGKPKGVMIEHSGAVNYIVWANSTYVKGESLDFALYSSISFDLTVTSIFTPILFGNKIFIYNCHSDENLIHKVFEDNKAGIVKLTPSHLQIIKNFKYPESRVKKLIVGGEELKTELCKQIHLNFNGDIEIYNEYGPTEAVVGCMVYQYDFKRDQKLTLSIGVPAANVKLYVFDKNMNLTPIGVSGELYIGGASIARGYLNNSQLTSDRFLNYQGVILYKTGDLVRWYPKGEMEYLGRNDRQVKIRGHRIELGEIEKQLSSHPDIQDCIVIEKAGASGGKYLCAYIVTSAMLSDDALRHFLYNKLPDFMIPPYFIQIDKVPLNKNGKIELGLLPEPQIQPSVKVYDKPTNPIEKTLADVWKKVFQIDEVGINDDFYNLGGDSLIAIQIQIDLLKHHYHLQTQQIYEYRTIKNIADKIIKDEPNIDCAPFAEDDLMNIMSQCSVSDGMNHRNSKNVLLIGSTGFLGVHILEHLLNSTDQTIYCLVRGKNHHDAEARLIECLKYYFLYNYSQYINKRIFVIKGDISLENIGVGDYIQLAGTIDRVIHCGALVKYYGDYKGFEAINVSGTENVAKFSLSYNIPLFYVSSMGISGQYQSKKYEGTYQFSENDFDINQNFDENPYLRSKYEAERVLRKYMKHGLRASILRVGNLSNRYKDGLFQKNMTDNSFFNIIKSIIALEAVSDSISNFAFDVTPVDYCSQAIIKLAMEPKAIGRTFHIYNHNLVNVNRLIKVLKKYGVPVKVLNNHAFSSLLQSIASRDHEKEALAGIINYIDTNNQLIFNSSVFVDSKYTTAFLKEIGFEWPEISDSYLIKIIEDIHKYVLMK